MATTQVTTASNRGFPAGFRKPAMAGAGLKDNLADDIGSSFGVIGYKGKVWTIKYQGETYTFRRPDGSANDRIHVVVVRQSPHKTKTFYKVYDENSLGERPDCASMDGVVPDPGVKDKQSDTCALCPQNQWIMDASGKRRKKCSDYKRLAVLLDPKESTALLGAPLMEPVLLRVPPASLASLARMGDVMGAHGFHYTGYVTEVKFVEDAATPKMDFSAVPPGLSDDEQKQILAMRDDPLSSRITGEQGEVQPTQQLFAEHAPKAVTKKADPIVPPDPMERGGFLDLKPNPPSEAAAPAAKVKAAPKKEEPQEADDDLESRIAKVLAS